MNQSILSHVFAFVFLAVLVAMRCTNGIDVPAFVSLASALLWAYLLQHVGSIGIGAVKSYAQTKLEVARESSKS